MPKRRGCLSLDKAEANNQIVRATVEREKHLRPCNNILPANPGHGIFIADHAIFTQGIRHSQAH
ncbi:hypothetical protein [Roseibium sediminicola]|uniref:Uncharacterized protein n=1 Tax=Roseibium sediminicola TaxID=2933272 RepID=A0ABT0GS84_9HYPH|nr:hypothetical protein [Roseibium sp. CAU 1639]MCK7611710.1 hypothetical protein [Roseibium sp. CAU 1639]